MTMGKSENTKGDKKEEKKRNIVGLIQERQEYFIVKKDLKIFLRKSSMQMSN